MEPAPTTTTPPNVRQAVPFLGVSDMPTSLRFYVDGLGFRVKTKWAPDVSGEIRWCWLELGTAALMLQDHLRNPAHPARAVGTPGQGMSVCFMCDDALAIYRDAIAKGLSPKRPFVGNNLWVVSFVDPDGYHIDFESPTDVPEETEYDAALHG